MDNKTGRRMKQTKYFVECPNCRSVREMPYKHAKKMRTQFCKRCRKRRYEK